MTSILLTVSTFSALAEDLVEDLAEAAVSVCVAADIVAPQTRTSPPRGDGERAFFQTRAFRGVVASLGALRPAGVLADVVLSRFVDHWDDLVLHGCDPIGNLDPFGAIPLLHIGRVVAVVIVAGHLERSGKAVEPDLFPACRGDLQRLQAATHFIAGDVLLAGYLLCVADGLGDHH